MEKLQLENYWKNQILMKEN